MKVFEKDAVHNVGINIRKRLSIRMQDQLQTSKPLLEKLQDAEKIHYHKVEADLK